MEIPSNNQLKEAQTIMLSILNEIHQICQKHNIAYWLDGGTLLGAVRHKGFIPWDDDIDIAMTRDNYEKFLNIAPNELPENLFLQTEYTDPGYFDTIAPMKIRDKNSQVLEWFETGNEQYHLGLFVDIFPYDNLPQNFIFRFLKKDFARNLLKVKQTKIQKRGKLKYKLIGRIFSLKTLNKIQNYLINTSKNTNSDFFGFGYDSALKRVYEKQKFYPLEEVLFENRLFLSPKDKIYYLTHTYGNYMTLPPQEQQRPKHIKSLKIF